MNEKYAPVFIRFGVIVLLLVGCGIALMRYLNNRGDTQLAAEEARAASLGWIAEPDISRPSTTEEAALKCISDAFAALQNSVPAQNMNLIASPDRWLSSRGPALAEKTTDRASQILSENLPTLEEVAKQPLVTSKSNNSHRRVLTYAMAARAQFLANEGKKEQAYGTLRMAAVIAGIRGPKPLQVQGELDVVVRTAWTRVALAFPTDPPPVPESLGALAYGKQGVLALIMDNYGRTDPDGQPMNLQQKKHRFDQLRQGSTLFEIYRNKANDLYSLWQYLKTENAMYMFHRSSNGAGIDPENHAAFLRDQAVREQLSSLFKESLANGGNLPAGLGRSRDPFNSSKPMKFKRYPDGFAIYSVGIDTMDGGGNQGDISIKKSKTGVRSSLETNGMWR